MTLRRAALAAPLLALPFLPVPAGGAVPGCAAAAQDRPSRSCFGGRDVVAFGRLLLRYGVDTLEYGIGIVLVFLGLVLTALGYLLMLLELILCRG